MAKAAGLSARVGQLLSRTRYEQITGGAAREDVERLRYRQYLREGAIAPIATGRMSDAFDELSNARIFGVYVDGGLAASVRLHTVSEEHSLSPGVSAFEDELLPLLAKGRSLLDPNRLVVDCDAARELPELIYATLRLPFLAAEYFCIDTAIATVRSEHRAFYSRVLGYVPVCPPRHYPGLTKPLGLMLADFKARRRGVLARYPFFAAQTGEMRALFGEQDGTGAHR